jgi:predicted acyltransferase
VLILLGLILNGLLRFNWPEMRWPGVLQRIGLCYFFAALIVLHTKWRTQAILVGVVLLLYWAVTVLVPVPGCAAGDVSMQGCLSSYIDQQLIPGQLYYKYGDNEGVLSTFPQRSARPPRVLWPVSGCSTFRLAKRRDRRSPGSRA